VRDVFGESLYFRAFMLRSVLRTLANAPLYVKLPQICHALNLFKNIPIAVLFVFEKNTTFVCIFK
jgi:hypothetical protein